MIDGGARRLCGPAIGSPEGDRPKGVRMGVEMRRHLFLMGIRGSDNILVSKHQCEAGMSRLTITLSEGRYRALKEASAQRDKTIGQLIDESLDFYGIKSREDARDLVRRARAHSKLGEDQALAVAQEQVRAVRRKP